MDFLSKVKAAAEKDEAFKQAQAAREAVGVNVEREYCFWVKPSENGWQWLLNQSGMFYLDILMPIENGRRRIRIDEDASTELTVKRFHNGDKIEENADIGFNIGISFYSPTLLSHFFKRIRLEADEAAQAIRGHHWDIDIFYKTQDTPNFDSLEDFKDYISTMRGSTNCTDWVKVELEVEEFVDGADVKELIPFECEELISSNPKTEEDKEFIRDYWERVTKL